MTKESWKSSNYSNSLRCVTLLSLWFSFTMFCASIMLLIMHPHREKYGAELQWREEIGKTVTIAEAFSLVCGVKQMIICTKMS